MKVLIPLVALFSFIFLGCGSRKPHPSHKTETNTLIVEKTTTYRDTVFVTEKAKASVTTPVENLNEKPQVSKNKNATQSLYKDKDGNIVADCECDSLQIAAKIKQELQKETLETVITETQIQKVPYVPFLVKCLAWIGGGAVVFLIGVLLIKMKI
ncbi:hypothetical protein ETU09_00510 [Apibacter muscae]|uniref:Uncharacterized protein n=1 Tax=Apibacter muscae TaxID=2509004 RepID=A0A563DJY6_9FLAO|nr:hypothetical protein [Apibacter muscae]TWP30515.1 hypothetical protein ETU09_00510 [Apibacter muscae]